MSNKEIIAMLLAGGRGTRLGVLTDNIAKPAVPFGAEYRIIDFALSNCSNSGIDTVGVLTQYKPLVLNSYLGIGSSWDLDRRKGGVTVLPPYVKDSGGEWYKGTANAVYQNIDFIDLYNPEYVLILSGDHIYTMDYSQMLEFHKKREADVSIAVIKVPWEETSRFGIIKSNENDKIIDFTEKPEHPVSNQASMGIYIFKWKILKKYLKEKEDTDFGKNIIPRMMDNNLQFYAYPFKGYWKDVGTVKSYWEAHMDLLADKPGLSLFDSDWPIYSVNPNISPHYISEKAEINNSLINKGSIIEGKVEHSVVFFGARIEEGTIVKDSIIMPNVTIKANSRIEKSIICSHVNIDNNCLIGVKKNKKTDNDITVISEDFHVHSEENIQQGRIIS